MDLYKKFKLSTVGNDGRTVFFSEDGANITFTKQGFVQYLNGMSLSEFKHLDDLLDLMNKGCKIDNKLQIDFDKKNGHQIIWLAPKWGNRTPKLRIPYSPEIMKFLQAYQAAEFRVDFTLRNLLEQAGVNLMEETAK